MRPGNRPSRHPQHPTLRDAGFSLLELLVYITILGLLIGMVGPALMGQLVSARSSVAHRSIERLTSVLDMHKLDVGSNPTTDQGLEAPLEQPTDVNNWNGRYLNCSKPPLDAWNHPYGYREPSSRPNHDYDLCSKGPSGDASGEAMICNNRCCEPVDCEPACVMTRCRRRAVTGHRSLPERHPYDWHPYDGRRRHCESSRWICWITFASGSAEPDDGKWFSCCGTAAALINCSRMSSVSARASR
jgi:general secretion pathway protein G